jgi:hypothetical protein
MDVLADIAHNIFNALGSFSKGWVVSQHIQRIVYQNTCSLLQTYHDERIQGLVVKLFGVWAIKLFISERSYV